MTGLTVWTNQLKQGQQNSPPTAASEEEEPPHLIPQCTEETREMNMAIREDRMRTDDSDTLAQVRPDQTLEPTSDQISAQARTDH